MKFPLAFGLLLALSASLILSPAEVSGAANARVLNGDSPIHEPYPALHGGSFTGLGAAESPDPLAYYRWDQPQAADGLQTYLLGSVVVSADQPGSFGNLHSVTTSNCNVSVTGTGSIRFRGIDMTPQPPSGSVFRDDRGLSTHATGTGTAVQ
jgi:hypothetical protein